MISRDGDDFAEAEIDTPEQASVIVGNGVGPVAVPLPYRHTKPGVIWSTMRPPKPAYSQRPSLPQFVAPEFDDPDFEDESLLRGMLGRSGRRSRAIMYMQACLKLYEEAANLAFTSNRLDTVRSMIEDLKIPGWHKPLYYPAGTGGEVDWQGYVPTEANALKDKLETKMLLATAPTPIPVVYKPIAVVSPAPAPAATVTATPTPTTTTTSTPIDTSAATVYYPPTTTETIPVEASPPMEVDTGTGTEIAPEAYPGVYAEGTPAQAAPATNRMYLLGAGLLVLGLGYFLFFRKKH